MTGYQEVLTDPSYSGQIVTMTCPEIGNYGVTDDDRESGAARRRLHHPRRVANREQLALARHAARLFRRNKIVAIGDIDTRALTRKLRSGGVMRGVVMTGSQLDPERARRKGARDSEDGRLRSRQAA